MAFRTITTHLNGIFVIEADRYVDERGYFQEMFRTTALEELGVVGPFLQDNHSRSTKGVVRGLHYQHTAPMGKLLVVLRGSIQLVEVDIRKDSSSYGQHVSIELSDANHTLVWIPPGFANGFCVTSDEADVLYKCTAEYNSSGEGGINPLDSALGIEWRVSHPIVSDKDTAAKSFADYTASPKF